MKIENTFQFPGGDRNETEQGLSRDLSLRSSKTKGEASAKWEFSAEEMALIESRRRQLSSLAYFIGKDFEIPVELNEPGKGWHWDFKNNIIRVDPKDLLERDMDYLRFVISHEGGHRRISRTGFIDAKTWAEPGFSFMMNAIEDPRDNNFVAENYPQFAEQMKLAYEEDMDLEFRVKERAKERLGYQPKFIQAGFEYIRQWFRESQGLPIELSADIPVEVREVVQKTLKSAQDSWWRYPSRAEADDARNGEQNIIDYAKISYEINHDEVWPEFRKLVEKDREDQGMNEFIKDMQMEKGNGGEGGEMSQELKDKLTEEEQKELSDAIDKVIEENQAKQKGNQDGEKENKDGEGGSEQDEKNEDENPDKQTGVPIDPNSLSEELRQKIKDYMDGLSDDKKAELDRKAGKALGDFEKEINKELEGALAENPEERETREAKEAESEKDEDVPDKPSEAFADKKFDEEKLTADERKRVDEARNFFEKSLVRDANIYEKNRREVMPLIDRLENDLREIFVRRRAGAWLSGYKTGKKIDIKKRIQEKAKGVSAMESRSWQKREQPQEKDYAMTLLVDLSGSMDNNKIKETFKAVIILAEVLNRLSIRTEILGFNDRIYEYQNYGENMDKKIRENMGGMLQEVKNRKGGRASFNDDGWALGEASERLAKERASEKFLIVLSDGYPEESPGHKKEEYELRTVVRGVMENTDQKLIGLGLLSSAVRNYYPNHIDDIGVEELSGELTKLLKDIIENYGSY